MDKPTAGLGAPLSASISSSSGKNKGVREIATIPLTEVPLAELLDANSDWNSSNLGKKEGSMYLAVDAEGNRQIAIATGPARTDPWQLTSRRIVGWRDNIAKFTAAKGAGPTDPTFEDCGNGNFEFRFDPGNLMHIKFHVNHDYARGTDAFPHVHYFCQDAQVAGATAIWDFDYVIAKGHSQKQSLTAARTKVRMTYTYVGDEIPGEHIVLECEEADAFDLIEPDTVISASCTFVGGTVTGKTYGVLSDLHYLADREVTINKTPNFYGE